MVNLISSLRSIKSIKALVVGDLVLDTYIQGVVERVSPEAPVPVVRAEKMFLKPGMAGNVALNLRALGAEVFLAGYLIMIFLVENTILLAKYAGLKIRKELVKLQTNLHFHSTFPQYILKYFYH